MSVRVALAAALADLDDGRKTFDAEGATVGEVLRNLGATRQGLARLLWNAEGAFNPALAVFLDDRLLRDGDLLETPVEQGSEIALISALEGG